jgi:hypothetical protein
MKQSRAGPGPNYGAGFAFAALESRPASGHLAGRLTLGWATADFGGLVGSWWDFRQHFNRMGGQVGDAKS